MKLSAVASPNAMPSVDATPLKNSRLLRRSKTEREDDGELETEQVERMYRNYAFLVPEEAATELAKRMDDTLWKNLMEKVAHITNGENILSRWKEDQLSVPEIKQLLKEADRWVGTPERAVYKIVRRNIPQDS
ncbi:unnamed protein product [Phytophthora lilii]|uniref:RxLR effector protein n=1 Tax=Phytophthora lilii TaxID=2077276 RepID=A0A9W6YIC6_9STRA|nr:unnamed protein product [Phytophthora lilii]